MEGEKIKGCSRIQRGSLLWTLAQNLLEPCYLLKDMNANGEDNVK